MADEVKQVTEPSKQATKPAESQEKAENKVNELKEAQKKLFIKPEEKKEPETFTQIDRNTLPDDIKPLYDNLQSEFSRKVSELDKKQGGTTQADREKILNETLDNLTPEQFDAATRHPVFINRLMNYLQRQGYQPQPQQAGGNGKTDVNPEDLELADPVTRKLFEQNQQLMGVIEELKGRVDQTDAATRNAYVQAEDARLQGKYRDLYNPESVNQFLADVNAGRRQLTREDIFRIMDYETATKRWFEWGREESYEEHPNKGAATMLSDMQQGGQREGYEAVRPQKGENRLSHFKRIFEGAKQRVANGERSPWLQRK